MSFQRKNLFTFKQQIYCCERKKQELTSAVNTVSLLSLRKRTSLCIVKQEHFIERIVAKERCDASKNL